MEELLKEKLTPNTYICIIPNILNFFRLKTLNGLKITTVKILCGYNENKYDIAFVYDYLNSDKFSFSRNLHTFEADEIDLQKIHENFKLFSEYMCQEMNKISKGTFYFNSQEIIKRFGSKDYAFGRGFYNISVLNEYLENRAVDCYVYFQPEAKRYFIKIDISKTLNLQFYVRNEEAEELFKPYEGFYKRYLYELALKRNNFRQELAQVSFNLQQYEDEISELSEESKLLLETLYS